MQMIKHVHVLNTCLNVVVFRLGRQSYMPVLHNAGPHLIQIKPVDIAMTNGSNISISLLLTEVQCLFWMEHEEEWANNGCEVYQNSCYL